MLIKTHFTCETGYLIKIRKKIKIKIMEHALTSKPG